MLKKSPNVSILVIFLFLVVSGNNKYPVERITFSNYHPLDYGEKNLKPTYVLLENTKELSISQIDKFKYVNGKIYILDLSGVHHLSVFDTNGRFLRNIGERGKGADKFIRLCDFDVDNQDNVYLYDTQQMNMLVYNSRGELKWHKNTPFRAEAFNLLTDNQFIFSILRNSQNDNLNEDKLLITDSTFSIKKRFFNYKRDFLDNKLTIGLFRESSAGILYNKPVNDSLFLFNHQGEIEKCFFLDFGTNTPPEEYKNDYEKLVTVRPKNQFQYLYNVPFLLRNNLIGNVFIGPDKGVFILNTISKTVKAKKILLDISHKNINFPIGTIGDSIIVSWLDKQLLQFDNDKVLIEDSVKEHIKNGGIALTLYNLKHINDEN
jgi:hypothetical protein